MLLLLLIQKKATGRAGLLLPFLSPDLMLRPADIADYLAGFESFIIGSFIMGSFVEPFIVSALVVVAAGADAAAMCLAATALKLSVAAKAVAISTDNSLFI